MSELTQKELDRLPEWLARYASEQNETLVVESRCRDGAMEQGLKVGALLRYVRQLLDQRAMAEEAATRESAFNDRLREALQAKPGQDLVEHARDLASEHRVRRRGEAAGGHCETTERGDRLCRDVQHALDTKFSCPDKRRDLLPVALKAAIARYRSGADYVGPEPRLDWKRHEEEARVATQEYLQRQREKEHKDVLDKAREVVDYMLRRKASE